MSESIQKVLTRRRPPRVKITYDVETGGAIEKKELPFIVGIFADLSGPNPMAPKPPLKERKMVEIDAENFDSVMATYTPGIKFKYQMKDASGDVGDEKTGTLSFNKLEHFAPLQVVKRFEPLKEVYTKRGNIRDVQARVESSDAIEELFFRILSCDATGKAYRDALTTAFNPEDPSTWASPDITLTVEGDEKTKAQAEADQATLEKLVKEKLWGDINTGLGLVSAGLLTPFFREGVVHSELAAIAGSYELADGRDLKAVKARDQAFKTLYLEHIQKNDALEDWFIGLATQAATAVGEEKENPEEPTDGMKWLESVRKAYELDRAAQWRNEAYADVLGDQAPASLADVPEDLQPMANHLVAWVVCNRVALSERQKTPSLNLTKLIDFEVGEMDDQISFTLNQIMHSEGFRELEASWRGLSYLVTRSETGTMLKLRVINLSWGELRDDLDKAVEFDQSLVFKMIYEAEYGTYGGAPYSLLVGDYYFGRDSESIHLLNKISEVAAAAHAPFLASVRPAMFGLESFDKLAKPRDLAKIFESVELAPWRSFREKEDSRYVALTLPRVLLRLPYGEKSMAVEGMRYEEQVLQNSEGEPAGDTGEVNYSHCLWGNPAYVLAERITHAFTLFGWTAAIRGVESGGLVEDLPNYTYNAESGDLNLLCPTQVAITDRREKELNDLGFISVCHCKGSNKAAFFGGQTTNLPKKYLSDYANSNAAISAMLPYVLAASRFAHYVKVIMREKVGSFLTRANVESFLNDWVSQYILLDDEATQDVKASYPLRAAKIQVTEIPGKPGAYNATMFLKPHFQLEELTTSIRLVAELPA